MQRKFDFGVGEFYHVYNRGADKRPIFLDNFDRDRFIRSLLLLNTKDPIEIRNHGGRSSVGFWNSKKRKEREKIVDIGAYCLMPNHFHILIREKAEDGLSLFMKKLLTSYSMYFNLRHKRRGALFESTFKATHVDNDQHLRHLFAYIHLNPIKIAYPEWPNCGLEAVPKAEEHLGDYSFSSYLDYANSKERPEKAILNHEAFPEYFRETKDFKALLSDWLTYRVEGNNES